MTRHTFEGGATRLRPRRFQPRLAAALVAVVLLAALSTRPASADGDGRRIVVEPPIAAPGATISVHGENLWTEASVVVAIVGPNGASRTLGATVTGPEGGLESRWTLPSDLPEGIYDIVVRTELDEAIDVELVVRAEIPILLTLVGLGTLAVLAFVAWAGARRRGAVAPSNDVVEPPSD